MVVEDLEVVEVIFVEVMEGFDELCGGVVYCFGFGVIVDKFIYGVIEGCKGVMGMFVSCIVVVVDVCYLLFVVVGVLFVG